VSGEKESRRVERPTFNVQRSTSNQRNIEYRKRMTNNGKSIKNPPIPAFAGTCFTSGASQDGDDSMKKKINIGLIGYGFMGRTHSNAYCKVNHFFDLPYEPALHVVCGLEEDKAKAFADQWGYQSYTTDWRKVIEDDKVDLVDICVPNNVHAEIAMAAAKAGKTILCEKPLALNGKQAREMVDVIEKAGVPNMVSYNYRRVPAVTLAKQLIDEGRLGQIFHYRANFLQDWTISTQVPQGGMATWRLDVKAAGSGVTGDLLAHCIDTAMWHNGHIKSVCAMTETFVKERMHAETGKVEKVGIDDACMFMCRFENGSLGIAAYHF